MNAPVSQYLPAMRERFRKRLLLFYSTYDPEGSGRVVSALTLRVPEGTVMSSLYSKYNVRFEVEEAAARAQGLMPDQTQQQQPAATGAPRTDQTSASGVYAAQLSFNGNGNGSLTAAPPTSAQQPSYSPQPGAAQRSATAAADTVPVALLPDAEKHRVLRRLERFYNTHFPEGAWKAEEALSSHQTETRLFESLCASYSVSVAHERMQAAGLLPPTAASTSVPPPHSSFLFQQPPAAFALTEQPPPASPPSPPPTLPPSSTFASASSDAQLLSELQRDHARKLAELEHRHREQLDSERFERMRLQAERDRLAASTAGTRDRFDELAARLQDELRLQEAATAEAREALEAYENMPPPPRRGGDGGAGGGGGDRGGGAGQRDHHSNNVDDSAQPTRRAGALAAESPAAASSEVAALREELRLAKQYAEALAACHEAELEDRQGELFQRLVEKAALERQLAAESQASPPSRRDLLHADGDSRRTSVNNEGGASTSPPREQSPSERRHQSRLTSTAQHLSTPASPIRVRGHASPEHPMLMVCGLCGEVGRERFCHSCGAAYAGHDVEVSSSS